MSSLSKRMSRTIGPAVLGIFTIVGIAIGNRASAQESLYGRQPGRNAVFLRFVSALDTEVTIKSDALPSQKLGTGDNDRIGPYTLLERVDSNGVTITARAGPVELKEKLQLKPGSKISVLFRPNGDSLQILNLVEKSDVNQTRTVLSFYNVAPQCGPTSLLLEPSSAVVFPDVPADAQRSRGINPINARFKATCREQGVATAELDRPEAGGAYSVWLFAKGGRPVLMVGTDTLPGWKP